MNRTGGGAAGVGSPSKNPGSLMRRLFLLLPPILVAGVAVGVLPAAVAAPTATGPDVCNQGPWSGPGGTNGVNGSVPGCTTRVSKTYRDTDPNGTSQRPRISEDGTTVVFQSGADNLVTPYAAGSGTHDFWARVGDPSGTITMVDRAADGGMPNSLSTQGATFVDVSPDGRYVVFYSTATNLVSTTTPTRAGDIYVRDMLAPGVNTIAVPTTSTGTGRTNGFSNRPTIGKAANGKYYIAYNSMATNLVAGATHKDDAYVTELDPTTFTVSRPRLLSHVPGQPSTPSNGKNEHAEISSDATQIAWQSDASNLSPKANGKTQVYEIANPFLLGVQSPVMVSVNAAGVAGTQPSTRPAINRNGDEVGFQSTSPNLTAGDTNAVLDVYVRGTAPSAFVGDGVTRLVSLGYNGQQLAGASQRINLSGDGSVIAFAANSAQTLKTDRNHARDVTLRNLRTGKNYLIDVCVAGTAQNGGFGGMTPPCQPLAPKSLVAGVVAAPAVVADRPGGADLSSRAFLSDDGTRVAYISGMDDLVPNDTNDAVSLDDVFVRQFNAF